MCRGRVAREDEQHEWPTAGKRGTGEPARTRGVGSADPCGVRPIHSCSSPRPTQCEARPTASGRRLGGRPWSRFRARKVLPSSRRKELRTGCTPPLFFLAGDNNGGAAGLPNRTCTGSSARPCSSRSSTPSARTWSNRPSSGNAGGPPGRRYRLSNHVGPSTVELVLDGVAGAGRSSRRSCPSRQISPSPQ